MQISDLREELTWAFCHEYMPENLNSILLVSKSSYTLNSVRGNQGKIFGCLVSGYLEWRDLSLSYRYSLLSNLH